MTTLPDKIDEILEHYEYALVGVKGEATDNKVYSNFPTSTKQLFNYLTIRFGAERVSKQKTLIKVIS